MADTVKLQHTHRTGDWKVYFYEGEADVKDGVLSLPIDRPEWIQRAWIQGFRHDTNGVVILGDRLAAMMAGEDDSSEEQTENEQPKTSSRRGRQSRTNDRVREDEPASSEDADEGGAQGSVPSGAGEQE